MEISQHCGRIIKSIKIDELQNLKSLASKTIPFFPHPNIPKFCDIPNFGFSNMNVRTPQAQ